ncbi:MAG TPA: HIT family protein [Candidatus Eisenbergiella stercorigallinarum]|uniref:HIT family protein n=1 Tax=Candidatus Eisenbergiella stercorigallinarum TaxID=2838557 RepID=A0A9D2QZD3_9FIRM|nr:HIT family protein [Candidatus Eisenbergiella stercorigallinarum]
MDHISHENPRIQVHDKPVAGCGVCRRIEQTRQGQNPYFVRELETGYVVIGDYQRFPDYSLFLCKEHATELHFLEKNFRDRFLQEMALTAEAVYKAFQPDKLNYELLGSGNDKHMHWHFFPRKEGDTPSPGPVWRLSPAELYDPAFRPSPDELERMKRKLNAELEKLL